MSEALFARQPIYDQQNNIFGFELLYRGQRYNPLDKYGAKATTEVLINYCAGVVEDGTNLDSPIFINLDQKFLTSQVFIPVPPKNVILEILETVSPTPLVLETLKTYKRQGFRLALDDYIYTESLSSFIPLVGIVKVDVINQSLASIRKLISHPQLKGKTLLAEKVESQEMYEECLSLGFELFQGYYLERPKIVVGAQLNVGQQTMMNLLSNLCRSDITVSEVADLIATDPVLVIKIMKIINCPLYPYKREITHLREAVVKLGIEPVKQWAVIFSLVANSSQPSELFRVLLIRAKACELYAKIVYPNDFQEYFLVGLFSSLDAVLGVDKETLYKAVNLPSSITDKLAPTEAKNLPNILSMILSYEQGDSQLSSNGSNDVDEVNNAYWAGVMWADEIMQFLA